MYENIFFTGTSGFAGKSLVKYLKKKKFELTTTAFKNIKNPKNKKNIKIDLTKKIFLRKNFDWIIHAAAYHKIKDFKSDANVKAKKNILMVKNLVDFANKNKVQNFIYFSTIDINYSPYPSKKNIYIKSKVFCEKILLTALKEKIFKRLVILRLPAIVGKQSNDNFMKNTLYNLKKNIPINIWNKNNKYNNLIHINDLSKLICCFLSMKNKRKKTIIDCLSAKPIKLEDLINNLKKKLNSKSNVNYINKKNKFKRIESNSKINYNFFTVKKAIDLLI